LFLKFLTDANFLADSKLTFIEDLVGKALSHFFNQNSKICNL